MIVFWYEETYPVDWLQPPDPNRWQGVTGLNNPCPDGWMIPDPVDWQDVINSLPQPLDPWNDCPLKIPFAGYRNGYFPLNGNPGQHFDRGIYSHCWSSDRSYSSVFGTSSAGNYSVPIHTNAKSVRCVKEWQCRDNLFDSRDGQYYNTVEIETNAGWQRNLNIGSDISSTINQSNNSTIEKYCYNDVTVFCSIFGGLYQWNEVMQYTNQEGTKGICPFGWHLPTELEWGALVSQLGYYVAGMKMKSTSGWHNDGNGTNSSGFTSFTRRCRRMWRCRFL